MQRPNYDGSGIIYNDDNDSLDLRIDHAGVDEGGEGLAVDQGGQTVINLLVCLGKHYLVMKKLAKQFSNVKYISFSRNFGKD